MKRHRRESGFAMLLVFLMAACVAITLYFEIPRVAFEAERQRGFDQFGFGGPDLLGACHQALAHFGKQLFRRGGPRAHGIELERQRIDFRLPPLVGFVQGRGQLFALVLGRGQIVFHLLQAGARLGQGIFDLGEAARGPRRLGQGLVERRLQGVLFHSPTAPAARVRGWPPPPISKIRLSAVSARSSSSRFSSPSDRPLLASSPNCFSRLAKATRIVAISPVSLPLSLSNSRVDCCAAVNSRSSGGDCRLRVQTNFFSSPSNSLRNVSWLERSSVSAPRRLALSNFACSSVLSRLCRGSTSLPKVSFNSSSAPNCSPVSISKCRSTSLSPPMRWPILAKVDLPLSSGRFRLRLAGQCRQGLRCRRDARARKKATHPNTLQNTINHSGNRTLPQPDWALAERRSRAVSKCGPDRRRLFSALRQFQVIEYHQGDSRRWTF